MIEQVVRFVEHFGRIFARAKLFGIVVFDELSVFSVVLLVLLDDFLLFV